MEATYFVNTYLIIEVRTARGEAKKRKETEGEAKSKRGKRKQKEKKKRHSKEETEKAQGLNLQEGEEKICEVPQKGKEECDN